MQTLTRTSVLLLGLTILASSCGQEGAVSQLHPLMPRYPDEVEVTQHYGPLVVRAGHFRYQARKNEAGGLPWNTWFYPLKDRYFFEAPGGGERSPLEKFDRFAKYFAAPELRNPGSRAQEWEAERYKREGLAASGDWMGYCHATAAAGILEVLPARGAKIGDIQFSVADLKALLIRTYEEVDGARNFGSNFGSDRDKRSYLSQADLYPDQLLRLLQVQLGDLGQSFYIDSNSTNQIWNEPVIWAEGSLTPDPANRNRLVGTLTLSTAKSDTTAVTEEMRRSGRGYEFLNSSQVLSFQESFTFELFGHPFADGSFRVEYGEWTGTSRIFHPDFATVVPQAEGGRKPQRRSTNPYLKSELVDDLIRKASGR